MSEVYSALHMVSELQELPIALSEEYTYDQEADRTRKDLYDDDSSGDGIVEINFSSLTMAHQLQLSSSGASTDMTTIDGATVYIDGYVGGKSSVYGASFNFINSIIGAGIIGMPYALRLCGFYLGIAMLIVVAYLVDRSVIMLIECGIKAGKYDFEELTFHYLGKSGYLAAVVFMFLFAYGAQIAYMVIVGDTVPVVLNTFVGERTILTNREEVILAFAVLVVLPLCLLKQLSSLANTSLVSILSDIALVLIVVFNAFPESRAQGIKGNYHDLSFASTSVFAGIGTISFAFVCQHNSFMVFRSLKRPSLENWRKVAHMSVGFSLSISLLLGIVGYVSFRDSTNGDILTNFPENSSSVNGARGLLALCMTLVFPLECYVTRHCLLSIVDKLPADAHSEFSAISSNSHRSDESDRLRQVPRYDLINTAKHIIVTLLLWGTPVLIAISTKKLGVVLALTGTCTRVVIQIL